MKIASTIAGILLGLIFLMASVTYFLGLYPAQPAPEPGSPMAGFGTAFFTTGYMTFVKVFELVGALLVIVPKTRNFGLLILGPIIVNIVAFHVFIVHGGFDNWMFIGIIVLSLFLLVAERKAFAGLLR